MAGYRILVIDDDPVQRELLEIYLKLSEYEVLKAEDGQQGIELIRTHKPDLILMDILMPGMDGFQTLEAIRKDSETGHTPVLILSSLDRQNLIIKGLEKGADDYITKPFDKAELLARIKAALRRVARNQRPEGVLEGDLANFTLADLLQNMEQAANTASIDMPDIDGEIFMEEGQLVFARQGKFIYEAAVGRILLLEKGRFTVKFDYLPPDLAKHPQPLLSVLMKEMAKVDEINALIAKIDPEGSSPVLAEDVGGFDLMEVYQAANPMNLKELLVAMENDIKVNMTLILKMLKKGVLKLEANTSA